MSSPDTGSDQIYVTVVFVSMAFLIISKFLLSLPLASVVLPMLIPSIAATWLIALVVSFDEVIVTIFVAGRQLTVPKLMFSQLRDRIDPTVSALSTLLIIVTILIMVAAGLALKSSRSGRKAVAGLVAGEVATREME